MKSITLPSGAKLDVHPAPFADARALYQALLEELKELKIASETEADLNFFKDIFCAGFSSRKVEAALKKCMERCLYNGVKVADEVFEPEEARQDYFTVCFEIAQENISPFAKNLYAKYKTVSATVNGIHA